MTIYQFICEYDNGGNARDTEVICAISEQQAVEYLQQRYRLHSHKDGDYSKGDVMPANDRFYGEFELFEIEITDLTKEANSE